MFDPCPIALCVFTVGQLLKTVAESDSSDISERSANCSSSDNKRSHFVFGGSFELYQGEPLAEKSEADTNQSSKSDGNEDEDGISLLELEKRFKREIPVDEW